MALKMNNVTGAIMNGYRNCSNLQFIREMSQNGYEAKATNVEILVEWSGVENRNVYRMMIADNGHGMNKKELQRFFTTLGEGGKSIGGPHDNFGHGAKISTLPWNKFGLIVMSWTKEYPDGIMMWYENGQFIKEARDE